MKEEDIRPEKIFDEYLQLAKRDVHNISKLKTESLLPALPVVLRVNMHLPRVVFNTKNARHVKHYLQVQDPMLKHFSNIMKNLNLPNIGLLLSIRKLQKHGGRNFGNLKQK